MKYRRSKFSNMIDYLVGTVFILAVIAVLVVIFYGWPRFNCWLNWKDSGMDSRYSVFSGCQIETAKGNWVNQKFFRAPGE